MLPPTDLLGLWDRCLPQPPAARALALLAAAGPAGDPATVPLGRRDAALLELHTLAFGGTLDAVADCPACLERLEVAVDAAELAPPPGDQPGAVTVRAGGYEVCCRLPTAGDLAALPADGAALFAGCVIAASHDGVEVAAGTLPASVRVAVEAAMAAADPGAELTLALTCPACEASWVEPLDPAAFVWAEVHAGARRLAAEVHLLAATYGWSEADILALSPGRRRLYLDLAG